MYDRVNIIWPYIVHNHKRFVYNTTLFGTVFTYTIHLYHCLEILLFIINDYTLKITIIKND